MAEQATLPSLAEIQALLKSTSEEERLRGVVELTRSRHPQAAQVLSRFAASDPSNRVRFASRKLLHALQQQPPAAPQERPQLPALLARLPQESDPAVVATLLKAIGTLGGPAEIPVLGNFLRDVNPRVRANAVEALGTIGQPVAIAMIMPSLQDGDHRVQAAAAMVLERLGEPRALPVLERMAASPQLWMRDSAAFALGRLRERAAVALLSRLLADASPSVRAKAEKGLEKFAAEGDAEAARLLAGLRHPEPPVATVEQVAEVLEARRPGIEGLESENPKLRMNIVNTIISERDAGALPALVDHLAREENEFVLSRMMSALGALGGANPAEYGSIAAEYLENADARVAANAWDALRAMKAIGFDKEAVRALESPEPRIRANAIRYLVACCGADPRRGLESMLASASAGMQLSAIHLVKELGKPVDSLRLAAASQHEEVQLKLAEIARQLAEKGSEEARVLLEDLESGAPVTVKEKLVLRKPQFAMRARAVVFDSIALGVVVGLASGLLRVVAGPGEDADAHARLAAISNEMLMGLVYWIVLFVRDGFYGGRGFGKRRYGLRVVDLELGTGCGYVKSMLRQSTMLLPGVNVIEAISAFLDPRGQRLIDKVLNTMVTEEGPPVEIWLETILKWGIVLLILTGIFFGR